MAVKISTTNSKLGIIPSVNLPPVITCRKDCPCVSECYALKGHYRFQNVKDSHLCNYNLYMSEPAFYFADIKHSINNGLVSYSFFRWHSSGDIVDERYLSGMVEVANALPSTSFLAFTKKFELVNAYIENGGIIPENLNIVFSAWGKELDIINPNNFPVAYVRFKEDERNGEIPSTSIECSGDCTNCLQCWKISKGESVVFNKH